MKRLKFYTVCMLVVAVIAAIVYLRYFAPAEPIVHRTVDPPAILQQIQALKELVTVKYTIQKVIGLQEETGPFSKEWVLVVGQDTVLGGVAFAELRSGDV